MNVSVNFQDRDFSAPILTGLNITPLACSWSAFGGPDQATLRLDGDFQKIINLSALLRCPTTFSDPFGVPFWWGFVDEIVINFEGSKFTVSLEPLFNKVKVVYTFISPDNHLSDQLETSFAHNLVSQAEYGIREKALVRDNLDDDFAENLRDIFLAQHAFPSSELARSASSGSAFAELHCSGWFSTLSWKHYQNLDGFYANYGPGPGIYNCGATTTNRNPSQAITPTANSDLQYAYFQLRKIGAPAKSIYAQVRDSAFNILATSAAVSAATLDADNFEWIMFTFSPVYSLVSGTNYKITFNNNGADASNYFSIKIDENMNHKKGHGWKNSSAGGWTYLPSITNPGSQPDLKFRFVCIYDTGAQIADIVTAGDQFFDNITNLTSGITTSPYRDNGEDCQQELKYLMDLGTSNNRKILAAVSPQRHLKFYEQPDPNIPTAYLDRAGRFYSPEGIPLSPLFPPIGQYAQLTGTNRITFPFDRNRIPACFIHHVEYYSGARRALILSTS